MAFFKRRKTRAKRSDRRGTATVEMAFCLPVMFFLFLGSMDLIRYNLLRNIVSQATYEAARMGLVRGTTVEEMRASIGDTLTMFGADINYDLTVTPDSMPASEFETITITLTCDIREAGWILSKQIAGDTMQESMTIKTE